MADSALMAQHLVSFIYLNTLDIKIKMASPKFTDQKSLSKRTFVDEAYRKQE